MRKSQRTFSGCSPVSQRAPSSPPASSSTTATISSSPAAGRQPERARDQVGPCLLGPEQLTLEACGAEVPGQVLLGGALVAGRVDRVEADQGLQELLRLLRGARRGRRRRHGLSAL